MGKKQKTQTFFNLWNVAIHYYRRNVRYVWLSQNTRRSKSFSDIEVVC